MQEYVNEEAQNLIDSGQIRIEDIGNNKESYLPLMENICSKMINALRRRSVTGIYVAFNTEDLDKEARMILFRLCISVIWIRIPCHRKKIQIF